MEGRAPFHSEYGGDTERLGRTWLRSFQECSPVISETKWGGVTLMSRMESQVSQVSCAFYGWASKKKTMGPGGNRIDSIGRVEGLA